MPASFEELEGILTCPDDRHTLARFGAGFHCPACRRSFEAREGLLELLPSRPAPVPDSVSENYRRGYREAFHQPFVRDHALAWGARETMPPAWRQKRERQVRWVAPLVALGCDPRSTLLADISSGAGYYTFAYAAQFRTVLHCDLSVDNLNYSISRARRLAIENILFLRIDYFQPPFCASLPRVLCLDTLIYGDEHERQLLAGILGCLSADGRAVVDFHNWNHNPLRRLGLLRDNFVQCRSYTKSEVRKLLADSAVAGAECFPFHQEFDPGSLSARLLSGLIPPVRFVYRLQGKAAGDLGATR